MQDLTSRASHFEFGSNWMNFVDIVDEHRILQATHGLERLFPSGELRGRRLLDIGCGSGLSMLAALRLGASEVVGFDIDANSVTAAGRLLGKFAPGAPWRLSHASILQMAPAREERFDVVYSWGVLHHTGDMWSAIESASNWVADDGLLAIAIYRATLLCGFWKVEKRLYARLPILMQAPIRWLYQAAFICAKLLTGQNPLQYIREYRTRGMSWTHDVHDWLGGYPYESASPEEIRRYIHRLGFTMMREYVPRESRSAGLFGSGCDEYVARRSRTSQQLDEAPTQTTRVEYLRPSGHIHQQSTRSTVQALRTLLTSAGMI